MADGQGPSADAAPTPFDRALSGVEFHYTQTDSFPALLKQFGASLVVTTHQANKLPVARAAGGGCRAVPSPTHRRLASRNQNSRLFGSSVAIFVWKPSFLEHEHHEHKA